MIPRLVRQLLALAHLNERCAVTAPATPDQLYELAYTRGKAAAYRRAAELAQRAEEQTQEEHADHEPQ